MKRTISTAALALVAIVVTSASGQTTPTKEEQQLADLVKTLRAQQIQIVDNQGKIETKLADVAEAIRLARLMAGKAGK